MAITRVQQIYGSTGTQIWQGTTYTISLNSAPTVGNTLLLYVSNNSPLNISSVTQSGSNASWASIYTGSANGMYIYVWALSNIPVSSGNTITLSLNSNVNGWCAIVEEISGLQSSNILDVTASNYGTDTDTFTTGTTSKTSHAKEYWVNLYTYNNSSQINSIGASPNNNYTIFTGSGNANPVAVQSSGWTGTNQKGGNIRPINNSGLIMTYEIVSSSGYAGGQITDTSGSNPGNAFFGVSLTLIGASGGVPLGNSALPGFRKYYNGRYR